MSAQPIPKKIKESNPDITKKTFNTLLIDGSNLLELSCLGDETVSSSGKQIGGIFQFFLQVKLLLKMGNFRYVYVFWDSNDRAGQLRYNYLPEYKANRDKEFDDGELSDYMKAVNAKLRQWRDAHMKNRDPKKMTERKQKKDLFYWQRDIIMKCLEELFIRQCMSEYIEADDFIGYYVTHKKPNEKIVIVSNDRDLTQLIAEDVIVYVQALKKFVNTKNHTEVMGYNYQNVLLKKIICGDNSDNIKGIKLVGETTLFNNFPDFKTRKVTLQEVIDNAKKINTERLYQRKKPLAWATNLIEANSDSSAGNKVYEVNEKIIDLKHPLMTDEAIELIESLMYAPIDPEGRSMDNLYKILLENDVDNLKDPTKFSNFFTEYMYLIDKETKNLEV